MQNEVEVGEKQQAAESEDADNGSEERLPGHLVPPVKERAQPEINDGEKFGAIKRVGPDTFLLLERAELPEAKAQPGRDTDRGKQAERPENISLRGLHADDQSDGQAPKQRGKTAHKVPERTE